MSKTKRSSGQSRKKVAEVAAAFANLKLTARSRATRRAHDKIIRELYSGARDGDLESFKILLHLAQEAALKILELTQTNFATARSLARKRLFWPSLLSQSKDFNREAARIAKNLELGAESTYPLGMKTAFRRKSVFREIAWFLLILAQDVKKIAESSQLKNALVAVPQVIEERLASSCAELVSSVKLQIENFEEDIASTGARMFGVVERLSTRLGVPVEQQTLPDQIFEDALAMQSSTSRDADAWFVFSWKILLCLTANEPEQNAVLRPLGKYKAEAFYRKEAKRLNPGEQSINAIRKVAKQLELDGVAEKTADGYIQEGIYTRLESAFSKVVNEQFLARKSSS